MEGDEEVVPDTMEGREVDVDFPRKVVLRMTLSLLGDVDTSVVLRQREAVTGTVPLLSQLTGKSVLGKSHLGESLHGHCPTGKKMETLHASAQDVAAQAFGRSQNWPKSNWPKSSILTDRDPQATVLFLDGIGADDHVHRSAMMGKLLEVPSLRGLLPFVRAAHLEPSRYKWADAEGVRHQLKAESKGIH